MEGHSFPLARYFTVSDGSRTFGKKLMWDLSGTIVDTTDGRYLGFSRKPDLSYELVMTKDPTPMIRTGNIISNSKTPSVNVEIKDLKINMMEYIPGRIFDGKPIQFKEFILWTEGDNRLRMPSGDPIEKGPWRIIDGKIISNISGLKKQVSIGIVNGKAKIVPLENADPNVIFMLESKTTLICIGDPLFKASILLVARDVIRKPFSLVSLNDPSQSVSVGSQGPVLGSNRADWDIIGKRLVFGQDGNAVGSSIDVGTMTPGPVNFHPLFDDTQSYSLEKMESTINDPMGCIYKLTIGSVSIPSLVMVSTMIIKVSEDATRN